MLRNSLLLSVVVFIGVLVVCVLLARFSVRKVVLVFVVV